MKKPCHVCSKKKAAARAARAKRAKTKRQPAQSRIKKILIDMGKA